MAKILLTLYLLLLSSILNAQKVADEAAIKKVINVFFEGLHEGDSTKISETLHKDVKIQTAYINKQGTSILKGQTRSNLLKNIASKKKTDKYFEKLLSFNIKIDANLATVWTPYEFYLNDVFSHCGANSFHLFNNNGKWDIIYLIDTRKRKGCKVN